MTQATSIGLTQLRAAMASNNRRGPNNSLRTCVPELWSRHTVALWFFSSERERDHHLMSLSIPLNQYLGSGERKMPAYLLSIAKNSDRFKEKKQTDYRNSASPIKCRSIDKNICTVNEKCFSNNVFYHNGDYMFFDYTTCDIFNICTVNKKYFSKMFLYHNGNCT
jgi:hypothetical protein